MIKEFFRIDERDETRWMRQNKISQFKVQKKYLKKILKPFSEGTSTCKIPQQKNIYAQMKQRKEPAISSLTIQMFGHFITASS